MNTPCSSSLFIHKHTRGGAGAWPELPLLLAAVVLRDCGKRIPRGSANVAVKLALRVRQSARYALLGCFLQHDAL